MKDERKETGLEGVLHTARAWELGDYGVIRVKWAEGAKESEVVGHWEDLCLTVQV